jgi:glucose-1-phosphate thymidylyltransferase
MKALILAAGYATRLYPLTKQYPKPLLEVKGRPIIDYIIEKLIRLSQIDEIIVVTNSKFFSYFEEWAAQSKAKGKILLVDDLTSGLDDRRGAVGDMYFAIERLKLNDDLLVIGGDNLFAERLEGFLSFAEDKHRPLVGIYDIGSKASARKYGVVKLNKKNRIIGLQEKPRSPASTLVAMCLYYFPKETLRALGQYLAGSVGNHDATGHYIAWLSKRLPVYSFIFRGSWYDIGNHRFYQKAKEKFKSNFNKAVEY